MQHNVCVFNNCAEEAPLNKIIYVTSSLQMDIRMKKEREGMGGGRGWGGVEEVTAFWTIQQCKICG